MAVSAAARTSDAGIASIHNDITSIGAASQGSFGLDGQFAVDKIQIPIR